MSKTKQKTGLLGKLAQPRDEREEGWKTVDELIVETPMSRTVARGLLSAAIQRGEVEVKKLKSPYKGGFRKLLNYREKTK